MSAIPLRDYVVSGLVQEATVNALLKFGEPMLSDHRGVPGYEDQMPFRAFLRHRAGMRTMGRPDATAQLAAEALLRKLRGGR